MTIKDSKKSFVKCDNNKNNYLVNLITPQCTLSAFLSSFMYFSRRLSIHSLHVRAVSDTDFPGVSLPNSTLRTLAIGSNSLCLIAWREATSVASSRSCFCSGHRKGRAMIFKGNVKDIFDMRAAILDFSCSRTALNSSSLNRSKT